MNVGIIIYDAGNLKSVCNALDANNIDWGLINTPGDFSKYSHLILPGVGAFKPAMENLIKKEFVSPIEKHIKSGNPFLGICVGFQLLFCSSEEQAHTEGLSVIQGRVENFKEHINDLLIPHVGWNYCAQKQDTDFNLDKDFYFTHSCFARCDDEKDILGESEYGIKFVSAVKRDNIVGFQFHPEKSHKYGLSLFKSFKELKC